MPRHSTFFLFLMLAASAIAEKYRCPGEPYDITESVHLARLAAFYSKCRHCPHAPGNATSSVAADPAQKGLATGGGELPLFTAEGVRGRYLNDLSRSTAAEIVGAMASCLWDSASSQTGPIPAGGALGDDHPTDPPEGVTNASEGIRVLTAARSGPSVVLAHDERSSAPDIVTGAGQALRRMGCQVVDIGVATRPALVFAINHLDAAGGVHVTGAGCDPGWTGLDFLSRGGIPCSIPGQLDTISERHRGGYSRPSRRSGSQRTFQASIPYLAGLWKHVHALRPLKIAWACPNHGVQEVFQHVFRKLACRLIPVETPTRQRSLHEATDPDIVRTAEVVRVAGAHLGLLVSDDGEQCTLFDERGLVVPPRSVARLLAEHMIADRASGVRLVLPAAWNDGPDAAHVVYVSDPNRERITEALRRENGTFGADGLGRYWFAEPFPACDALLTLVHLLQSLSRSDTPFSEVVR